MRRNVCIVCDLLPPVRTHSIHDHEGFPSNLNCKMLVKSGLNREVPQVGRASGLLIPGGATW